MPEETPGVPSRHRVKRPAHRFDQGLAGARLGSPQEPVDLRERPLDRVEVRRVGRKVQQLAATPLYGLPPRSLTDFWESLDIPKNS